MDAAYFTKLFEYDYWSNKEVLKALEESKNPPEKALQLLSHILAAENVWYARLMEQDSSKLRIWPEYSWEECQKLTGEVFRNWMSYLEDLSAKRLNEKILYWNSKGTAFETASHPGGNSRGIPPGTDCRAAAAGRCKTGRYRLYCLCEESLNRKPAHQASAFSVMF